jgi:hypothetical protein
MSSDNIQRQIEFMIEQQARFNEQQAKFDEKMLELEEKQRQNRRYNQVGGRFNEPDAPCSGKQSTHSRVD